MNRVTTKDIAKIVGITSQNVSGVLNGNPNCRVSAVKRERILQVARELGYCKNISAQILRGDDTHTLAILFSLQISQIYDEYLYRIIVRLISYFNSCHYSCFLQEAWDPSHDSLRDIKELYSRGVTKFIIIGSIPHVPELESFFQQMNCSYIQCGDQFQRNGNFFMNQALLDLWEKLSSYERKHFKMITNTATENNYRLLALQQLPDWEEMIFPSSLVSCQGDDPLPLYLQCGYEDTEALLQSSPETKVIFYHSDHYLLGGIKYCVEHHLAIGEDIQLVGVNYSDTVRLSPFPIWSLSFPEKDFLDFFVTEINRHESVRKRFEMKLEMNLSMKEKLSAEGRSPEEVRS